MKAEAMASSAELLLPDLIQACPEGMPAAGAGGQGDFLPALLAAMVQQGNNGAGVLQGEKPGEGFQAPLSLPGQAGIVTGRKEDKDIAPGICWQYLFALQGSTLYAPQTGQFPAENGTAAEHVEPSVLEDLSKGMINGILPVQPQAVLPGGTTEAAKAPEPDGIVAVVAPGQHIADFSPVTADGNQGKQASTGQPAGQNSASFSPAGHMYSGGEQGVKEPAVYASLAVFPSGSNPDSPVRQDAIPPGLQANGMQFELAAERTPAAGDAQNNVGIEAQGLSGVMESQDLAPVKVDKPNQSAEPGKDPGDEPGAASGDIGRIKIEGRFSQGLQDTGHERPGKWDTPGAAAEGDHVLKATPGSSSAEAGSNGPADENGFVDGGEMPGIAGQGIRHDPGNSSSIPVSSINPRKFPEVILPHVAAILKNGTPDHARVTVIRLKLEPENMGEIKIKLSYAKGELTAHFFTASGLVKDAVECSLPQLKETLAQHNISLGEAAAFVGQEQQGQKGTGSFAGFGYAHQGRPSGGFSGDTTGEPAGPVYGGNNGRSLDMLI